MEDAPFGIIEILLAFGVVLGLGVWELVRTRRALRKPGPSGRDASER